MIGSDDTMKGQIQKMHNHIKFRNYFLRKNESLEHIAEFDTDADKFFSTIKTIDKESVFDILDKCLVKTGAAGATGDCKIEFISNADTVPTANLVILKSKKPFGKTDGYELISQVYTLSGLNHHVYFNNKDRKVYNDVEVRESQNLLFKVEEEKIWLYKKIGETYRELLINKYQISNAKIDISIKRNPLLSFVVDRFLKVSIPENNGFISKFMKQYLADESLTDLGKLVTKPFSGINYRHGICNYTGYMSPFIAAMQLMYDAVPLKSGINYSANLSAGNSNLRLFENQLLNTEYCLQRIFENIQTVISTTGVVYDPLNVVIKNPKGQDENIFYNYQICVNYIKNINIVLNMANPTITGFPPEYALSNVVNNYYYKLFANNFVPGFDITHAGAGAVSDQWYLGKYWSILSETFHTGHFDEEFDESSDDIKATRENYLQDIATDEEKRAFAYKTLAKKIIESKTKPGSVPTDFKIGALPDILKNECVDTIHKLIIVLFKGFNVFIDFEDDLRTIEKKLEKFVDGATKKEPNFVIKIASLPRLPTVSDAPAAAIPGTPGTPAPTVAPTLPTAPGKNWIKITGFDANPNAEYANGVYLPYNNTLYKHTEHNSIFIKYDGTKWVIFNKTDTGAEQEIAKSATLVGVSKWELLDTIYSAPAPAPTFTPTTGDITVENIGATYLPNPGEQVDKTKTLTFTDLPNEYTLTIGTSTNTYKSVGTIYKSIYHDFFYKYYNESHQILLSDCNALYGVNQSVLAQNTVDMFPFIRLYKKESYDLSTITTDAVIYQDVLKWTQQKP